MQFSEHWLREWVNPSKNSDELAEQLTMAGLEVGSVSPVAHALQQVVVAEIKSVTAHPSAERLHCCEVSDGSKDFLQIITGDSSVTAGMKVALAKVGANLSEEQRIEATELQGVMSYGMLCSAMELGIAHHTEGQPVGILQLPNDAPVGESITDYLQLDDNIIDIELTPNRGDCLGILGVAREVAMLNGMSFEGGDVPAVPPQTQEVFSVELKAEELCSNYAGRVIKNINPTTDTPLWMRERLCRGGIRSIAAVVDVTNYVMLEFGQPMHAFDLDNLSEGIVVRRAEMGENITLLDGKEVSLDEQTLLIADRKRPLAIAGIMGGEHTGITDKTQSLFLESAFFEPVHISLSSRQLGIQTDSSYRFSRGVDPSLQVKAIERATALLLKIVGGEPGPVIQESLKEHLPQKEIVELRHARIERVLGMEVPPQKVTDILTALGMKYTVEDETSALYKVFIPLHRFDVSLEIDLIEEIARIMNYNQIPSCMPRAELNFLPIAQGRITLNNIRELLINRGYFEAITYSFVEPSLQQLLDPEHKALPLTNPISAELSVMRTSLWPGLVTALLSNTVRQQERVRLFETGLRFQTVGDELSQVPMLAGLTYGSAYPEQWGIDSTSGDFFDMKSDVLAILKLTHDFKSFTLQRGEHPALHPGQQIVIQRKGETIGYMGALHPAIAKQIEISGAAFLFELQWNALMIAALPQYQTLSKFPSARRDLAIVVDTDISSEDIAKVMANISGKWLKDIHIFDVYSGEKIPKGKKSIAMGLTLHHASRTLTDSEVSELMDKIVEQLQKQFDASLRDSIDGAD